MFYIDALQYPLGPCRSNLSELEEWKRSDHWELSEAAQCGPQKLPARCEQVGPRISPNLFKNAVSSDDGTI